MRYDATYYYNDGALWDHTGNPLKRVETFGSTDYTTTFRYDNVYRLTEETLRDSGGAVQYTHLYTYDEVGNRVGRNDGGTLTLAHVYDANDKLLSTRWVGGGPPGPITANFYYDGAGNMTSVTGTEFGAWTLEYDDESRPVTITYPTGTDSFVWNALGQRMRVTLNGTVYRYVYAGDRVLEETTDAGGLVARYSLERGSYYAPWVATYLGGLGARFPLMDGVGTTRRLVTSGNTAWDRYELDAFGADRGSWTNYHNPYRFGGAWGYITDTPGSGLLQLGARFYWPELGRFIQQDPVGDGMNWYAYAGNNPLRWADPTGLRLRDALKKPFEALGAYIGGKIERSIGRKNGLTPKDLGLVAPNVPAAAAAVGGATAVAGTAVAGAAVVTGAVCEAGEKAGTAGTVAKAGGAAGAAGLALGVVGGLLNFEQAAPLAESARTQMNDRIMNPSGTDDDLLEMVTEGEEGGPVYTPRRY